MENGCHQRISGEIIYIPLHLTLNTICQTLRITTCAVLEQYTQSLPPILGWAVSIGWGTAVFNVQDISGSCCPVFFMWNVIILMRVLLFLCMFWNNSDGLFDTWAPLNPRLVIWRLDDQWEGIIIYCCSSADVNYVVTLYLVGQETIWQIINRVV